MPRMRRYFNRVVPMNPKSDLNVTPFIDVLLVLLVMLILTMPMTHHSTEVDLPAKGTKLTLQDENILRITEADTTLWNGAEVDQTDLRATLTATTKLVEQPVLRFAPDALASYDRSAKTIALIKESGVKKLTFDRLYEHKTFGK